MWTPSRQPPLSSCSSEIASSKSRASTGSIVTIVSPVKSRAVADRFVERFGLPAGFVQGIFGELVGQVELADDRERVDARLSARAEHFGDHALAVVQRRGEADHLDDHFVVGPGVLCARIADVDRPGEQRAVDLHVGRAGRLEIRADELVGLPLDDFDDLAAGAGIAVRGASSVRTSTTSPVAASPAAFGGDVDVLQVVAGRKRRRR